MPTKRRPAANHPPDAGVDLVRPSRSSRPLMPHERDESTGVTGGAPSRAVHQGYRDLRRGVQDTSRAPEADAAYQAQKSGPAKTPRDKRR